MVNTSGLPSPLILALHGVRDQVHTLRTPYTESVTAFNPATMKPEVIERQVQPRVSILIDMPAPKTVRVYAQRIKPYSEPVMLKSFTEDHFEALGAKVAAEGVSWEEFFLRVAAD